MTVAAYHQDYEAGQHHGEFLVGIGRAAQHAQTTLHAHENVSRLLAITACKQPFTQQFSAGLQGNLCELLHESIFYRLEAKSTVSQH